MKTLKSLVNWHWRLASWTTGWAMTTFFLIAVGFHLALISKENHWLIGVVIAVMLAVYTVITLRMMK